MAAVKLSKGQRDVVRDICCHFLWRADIATLQSIFDTGDKNAYHELVREIANDAMSGLQSAKLCSDTSMLSSGKIRDEILRFIRQIKVEAPRCSQRILSLHDF